MIEADIEGFDWKEKLMLKCHLKNEEDIQYMMVFFAYIGSNWKQNNEQQTYKQKKINNNNN